MRRTLMSVVVIATTATLFAADVGASRDRLVSRWQLSLGGTQTFTWEVSSSFDTSSGENCTIRHAGDQTIRFETSVPVKVVRGDSPTVTSDAQAHPSCGASFEGSSRCAGPRGGPTGCSSCYQIATHV